MSSTTTDLPTESVLANGASPMARTVGYFAAFVALGLFSASMGPTLPALADHTHSHLNEISFLFTGRSLGYLAGSFLAGRLYDRIPGHRVMAGALLLLALMMISVPLIPLLWLLTIALLVLGMAEGAVDVGGNTLLLWVHREKVGPIMNGLHFFFGLGAFFSPIIVAQAILWSGDIKWAYWMLALLMVPAFGLLVRMPSPARPAASHDTPAARANGLLVFLIVLFFFLYVGAEVSFGGWIYTYSVALNLGSATSAAYMASAFWGALTLGRLLGVPLAARFSPRAMLLGDLIGALAGVAIILLWPGSLAALWGGTFVTGFSTASIFPTAIVFAERRMPMTGQTTAWFLVGASAGGMFLPWLIGQLFEAIGPRVTMFAIAIDLLVAMALFLILVGYTRRRDRSSTFGFAASQDGQD